MKKIFYSILAAAAIFTGCNRELIVQEGVTGKGSLKLDVDCESDYTEIITKAGQTEEEILNSLVLDIFRPSDGSRQPSLTYRQVKDNGGIIELPSGSYELTVSSPSKKDFAFDQPIYEARKNFEIKIGEITNIGTITCTIKNVKVSLEVSENFLKELVSFDVTVSNGMGNLMWTQADQYDEAAAASGKVYKAQKAAFFSVAPLTVKVSGKRSSDGSTASKSYSINEVKVADHHIIKLDAKVTGSLDLDINIDSTTNDKEQTVPVPGFDEKPVEGNDPQEPENPSEPENPDEPENPSEPENPDEPENPGEPAADAPTLVWEANPTYADVDLPMSVDAVVDVELTINAPKGIKEFLIFVKSGALTETIAALTDAGEDGIIDGVATMDMINDPTLYENLGDTLPMGEEILNQTSVPFSLSGLVPMINLYGDSIIPGDKHIFTLRVTDNAGQVLEQAVTFVSVAAN